MLTGSGITLSLWLFLLLSVFALLGIWQFLCVPIMARIIANRERRINVELSGKLLRPLPKLLQTRRNSLIELLLHDAEVQEALQQEVESSGLPLHQVEKRARSYIDELMPAFAALFYFRVGYWLARQYLRQMYHIRIARNPPAQDYSNIPHDASIVLVGNHRSNIDVAVILYLSARTNMISFAAGEWASIWPMRQVVHLSGSYIIRRDSQGSLYKQVLSRYVSMMIKARMPQGIFLEGGLSRDGAIGKIKLGMMRYILANLGKPGVGDIVFIPVAFNYERTPEDLTLLARQVKGFGTGNTVYALFGALRHIGLFCLRLFVISRKNYGEAAVSFGAPLSMRTWLQSNGYASAESLDDDTRRAIVEPVAEAVMQEIRDILPVLAVSVVAIAFCESSEAQLSAVDIKLAALQKIKQLRAQNVALAIAADQEDTAVAHGLQTLLKRQVVHENNGMYHVIEAQRPLLEYYYRTTEHFFKDVG